MAVVCSVTFSNMAYMRKQVEFESTVAAVNRIVSTMEQIDGYEVGKTPVAWGAALVPAMPPFTATAWESCVDTALAAATPLATTEPFSLLHLRYGLSHPAVG